MLVKSIDHTLEQQADEIKTRGYTVIENVLSQQDIDAARLALDQILRSEDERAKKRGCYNGSFSRAFMLPQKHPIFRSICFGPKVLALVKLLLGDDCVLSSLNGLSMRQGGEPQHLHRDSLGIADQVLTINVLHTLDHFTRESGCTRLVPYSQNVDGQRLGSTDKADFLSLEDQAVYIEVPAGSVIAYNGALVHAGSSALAAPPRAAVYKRLLGPES